MKKIAYLKLSVGISIILSSFAIQAHAVDRETAFKIVSVIENVQKPDRNSSDFQKWAYDTLIFTGAHCWNHAFYDFEKMQEKEKIKSPQIFKQSPFRQGTFSLPHENADTDKICNALANKGFKPWCSSSNFYTDALTTEPMLPRDYLQYKKVEDNPQVKGGLECHITEENINRQSFYPDSAPAKWITLPRVQRFNLFRQEVQLNAGTVEISLPHVPSWNGQSFREPKTAIIVK